MDRVVTSDEHHSAPLQSDDVAIVWPVEAVYVLNVVSGRDAWLLDDERIRGELAAGLRRELVLVPCRLREQGKMSASVDGRDRQEVLVTKRNDLTVHGLSHQAQPW